MHIHILGICGTFMGSLAVLARELGHEVAGSDANVYPPMSTQLENQGITLRQGYCPENLQPAPELVVIGNAMSRGNPAVEYVLDNNIPYCSGPEFLARWVLQGRWVLGVAGTHGKTTTSSMLAWIIQHAGLRPGYLIGGVAGNFPTSATVGEAPFFVVEADEYDTAFFDKRSKFVHYAPRTAILNNLEFDHGDIFEDIDAIKKQFHHLVRTIPSNGLILHGHDEQHILEVLDMGCWTPVQRYAVSAQTTDAEANAAADGIFWNGQLDNPDGSGFRVQKFSARDGAVVLAEESIEWEMTGSHNVSNGLAAVAAAHHAGVSLEVACQALSCFAGVKRRMELRGEVNGIRVFDDFAHHPTAIASTLAGLAARLAGQDEASRLIAVIEPRSNTMKMRVHQERLAASASAADLVIWKRQQGGDLDLDAVAAAQSHGRVLDEVEQIIAMLVSECRSGDNIVIMSNGGFEGIHGRLLEALQAESG